MRPTRKRRRDEVDFIYRESRDASGDGLKAESISANLVPQNLGVDHIFRSVIPGRPAGRTRNPEANSVDPYLDSGFAG